MLLSSRRNRGLKSGRNWGRLSAASVVAIVIVLNLFAQKYPIKFDFSEGNRYSISETTLALLSDLPRDITVYALFDDSKADRDYLEVCELLEVYKKSSKGRVSIEYRDPDLDTRIVSALDPDGSLDLRKNSFYVTDGARGKKLVYGDLFELQYDGKTSAWFVTGSAAERAITGAISELSKPEATARALYGYTILSAEETPELPEPGESFSELTLAVEATDIVPLEFFGLYFPTASEFDPPEGASVLVPSLGGKALAAAWERDGARHVLIGSADFMSDDVKREYPAHYVTNEYFRSAALEWVNAGNITAPVRDYRTGELQIPVYKANFVGFLTIAVLPFVIFGRGFIVWRGRRYL
jgi:hypothetical protein